MEKTLKEEVVWENSDKGVMTITKEEPVIIDGKETGTHNNVFVLNCTWEDVLSGKETIELQIDKAQAKVEEKEEAIENLGKIPKKTGEMVRLAKALEAIGLIEQNAKLKAELNPLQESLIGFKHNLKERVKVIESRPQPAEE